MGTARRSRQFSKSDFLCFKSNATKSVDETRSASSSPDHGHIIGSDDSLDVMQPPDEHQVVISHPSWQYPGDEQLNEVDDQRITMQWSATTEPNEQYFENYRSYEETVTYGAETASDGQYSLQPVMNEGPSYVYADPSQNSEAWLSCL